MFLGRRLGRFRYHGFFSRQIFPRKGYIVHIKSLHTSACGIRLDISSQVFHRTKGPNSLTCLVHQMRRDPHLKWDFLSAKRRFIADRFFGPEALIFCKSKLSPGLLLYSKPTQSAFTIGDLVSFFIRMLTPDRVSFSISSTLLCHTLGPKVSLRVQNWAFLVVIRLDAARGKNFNGVVFSLIRRKRSLVFTPVRQQFAFP